MNSWTGRVVGLLIGMFLGGPLTMILGFALGYYFYDKPKMQALEQQLHAQSTFTNANSNLDLIGCTFALMGYVARGAGRINEDQIRKAEQIVSLMHLDDASRRFAIAAFNRGKAPDFQLQGEIYTLRNLIGNNLTVVSYLLEIQVQIALADGILEDLEHERLLEIATLLGVSNAAMDNLIRVRMAEMRFSQFYRQSYSQQDSYSEEESYQQHQSSAVKEDDLAAAYQILGVNKDTPFEEVKKAHKRLMLKYHPDRLASQGLTQEMVNLYTEKAKDIQAAFDLIKKQRGE